MKRVYVALMRTIRRGLAALGVLALLERLAPRSRAALWLRSLVSIYDAEDLLRLDVPWWTFDSADLVAAHLAERPGARVLEWGSGASTVWLSKRAGTVRSIEHDTQWARVVSAGLPANCELLTVPAPAASATTPVRSRKSGNEDRDFGAYVAAADDVPGEFDLVVIDGRAREACLERAVHRLAPGGVILFDNVDRRRYVEAIEACPVPLRVTWTRGLTPSLPYPTRTAVITLDR